MILSYDGTLEGFLSLVYEAYYRKLAPTSIQRIDNEIRLFETSTFISRQEDKASKVLKSMRKYFAPHHVKRIMHMFLCDTRAFELELLEYIKLGFKDPKQLENINHEAVHFIDKLEKELFRVYHRYCGFLRFKELEDSTLYATFESDFSLVYLLGEHFSKRFANQNYIIHDIQRDLAFVKLGTSMDVRHVAEFETPIMSHSQEKFENLWRTFFDSIAINTRANASLQRQFVPLKYRTFMTEFT